MTGASINLYFYFCPVCFDQVEPSLEQHPHRLVRVVPGDPGSERRKPVRGARGEILSRAPRWFVEALQQAREEAAIYA